MLAAIAVLAASTHGIPAPRHANSTRSGVATPSRAQQIVLANEWWCTQEEPGRGVSLACRRHALQQHYASTADGPERKAVHQQLSALLLEADGVARERLHADTKELMRQFCVLPSSTRLDVCDSAAAGAAATAEESSSDKKPVRRRMNSQKQQTKRGGGGGGKKQQQQQQKGMAKGNGRKGISVLWTTDTLQVLRTWWCADRRHAREPRCSRGVRWTREQRGLSAMRRLFCAQSERGGANVAKLCLGAPGVAAAAVGMSRGDRRARTELPALKKNAAALVHGRPRRGLRPSTVNKIMFGLLVLAGLTGWVLSRAVHRKPRQASVRAAAAAAVAQQQQQQQLGGGGGSCGGSSSWNFLLFRRECKVEPAQVAADLEEEFAEFVVGAAAARRRSHCSGRSKRARTASDGGLLVIGGEASCAGTL